MKATQTQLQVRQKGLLEPVTVGDRDLFVLEGEYLWLLEGEPSAVARAHVSLGRLSTRLTSELLEVNFGNAVGIVEVPGLGRIEIASGKWDRQHFDHMLAELMVIAGALPFAATGAAALPYDRNIATHDEVLYHTFVYLRHALSDAPPAHERLLPPLEHVIRDPHRRLNRTQERTPLERVHRLSTAALTRLVSGQEELVEIRGGPFASLPLTIALKGHLPPSIEHVRIEPTSDTPENRFVKAFLDQALAIVKRVLARAQPEAGLPPVFAARLRADCESMRSALWLVRRHPLWREVGQMTHLPAGSTVLQQRRGYREVYWHFGRLRQAARVPLDPDSLRRLLEIRDIAELYEVWCFYSLVRLLSDILGPPARAVRPQVGDFGLSVPRDLEVVWANGVRLLYNPSYSRSGAALRRSYSVPLRPDIALEVASGPNRGLHLLDAKFKLDKLAPWLTDDDPDGDERHGTFKKADLYKMHTYRDAILRAHSVWVLYPGTETHFFAAMTGQKTDDLSLPDFVPMDGVGGVPLVPDATDSANRQIRALLARLVGH